jgi:hypothetical protein
VKIK